MELLLIITIFYILPVILSYWYIRLAYYHPRGRFKHLEVEKDSLFYTFSPIINCVFVVGWLFYYPIKPSPSKYYTNFFKPKNHKD